MVTPDPPSPSAGSRTGTTAWIVTVGDEILAGDIADTNLAYLAQRCRRLGIAVVRAVSVRDREAEVAAAVREATLAADVCLVSGGLGPTTDDLTAAGVGRAAGLALRRDEEALARIEAKFRAFGREMPPANRKQADFPAGADVLANPIGTAEGFGVTTSGGEGSGIGSASGFSGGSPHGSLDAVGGGSASHTCRVFAMPGVPRELRKMMTEQVEPRIADALPIAPVPRRVYRVLGHGESSVAERIAGLLEEARRRSPGLASMFVHYRASMPRVTVIVEGVPGPDGAAATQAELASLDGPMLEALSPGIYGIGEDDLATRVVASASAARVRIATAESCTGGGLGAMLTSVSGSSACFVGGVIAYSNEIKQSLLGVPEAQLVEHGAVSEQIARSLASGARRILGADLAAGITGIAGPDGGTPEKPVGTVHIAVCDESDVLHKRLRLRGDRGTVQRAAAEWALKLMWDRLVARGAASVSLSPG